ncbi:hypothetical protein RHSIM_Rhsim06G0198900 [Rhododendron simsii]|uniref:Uncharacterized protein n=1 Tax=Rhododendron simsii TaxID=118357 RepID=A0A834GW09_RHOSS|nr:hypothetical protein RHSIM_Rhsim06G0198900 [Rhododendron simsii]
MSSGGMAGSDVARGDGVRVALVRSGARCWSFSSYWWFASCGEGVPFVWAAAASGDSIAVEGVGGGGKSCSCLFFFRTFCLLQPAIVQPGRGVDLAIMVPTIVLDRDSRVLWTIKKLTNDSIFEGKNPRCDEVMDSIKLKGLRASVTEVAGAGTVHLTMRCGKAVGYIEFDHPKYVPMAIDLSGQLLVGERKEIKPLNADGNPSSAGERCHARTGKNNCLDKPWHLMTYAERIDSSTDWRELIDVDDRRVFYNKVTGERWTTILNDLWRARLKAGCYKHILLYGSPRRPRTLHQHETWQQGRVRENIAMDKDKSISKHSSSDIAGGPRHYSVPLRLIIFLPPRIHKKEYPRKPQHQVSNNLPQPIVVQRFKLPLKANSPNCHDNMKQHTPFSKEALKLSVLNKCHHEQKKPNGKQKQPRKGIGGSNQELIMWR